MGDHDRSRKCKHKYDAAEVTLEAISRLIHERHLMPDESHSLADVKKWTKNTLGTSLWGYIDDIYDDVETTIPQTLRGIIKKIEQVPDDVRTEIQNNFSVNTFAGKLRQEAEKNFCEAWGKIEPELEKGFKKVIDYITAIGQITNAFHYYLRRFEYAEHSLKDLAGIVGKKPPTQNLFNVLKQLLSAQNAKDATKALAGLAYMLIVENSPVFMLADTVLNVIKKGPWSNAFPYAIAPGDLNAWINPASQKGLPKEMISEEERDFRLEMVAAIDHYCHGKFGGGDGKTVLRAADDRLAIELIADISSVLFSTVFGYVLRRPALPSPTLPKLEWAHPFNHVRRASDFANKLSVTFSRQVAYPLKAGLGLLLRGFWDVSTLNNSLVEGVTSLTSSSVSSLLESFLYDFLWSVEIREAYALPDPKEDEDFVWGWQTQEPIYNDQKTTSAQYLSYGVWVRKTIVSATEASCLKDLINPKNKEISLLQKVLMDYGAYTQSIRDYTDDQETTDIVTDKVEITSTDSPLSAQSTYPQDFPSIPVLRAYCGGKCVVMKKTGATSGTAQYECDLEKTPEGAVLYVRSNYGGTAQHPLPKS